jgi:hypothetical protein
LEPKPVVALQQSLSSVSFTGDLSASGDAAFSGVDGFIEHPLSGRSQAALGASPQTARVGNAR